MIPECHNLSRHARLLVNYICNSKYALNSHGCNIYWMGAILHSLCFVMLTSYVFKPIGGILFKNIK